MFVAKNIENNLTIKNKFLSEYLVYKRSFHGIIGKQRIQNEGGNDNTSTFK